jgi:hypothetical protein
VILEQTGAGALGDVTIRGIGTTRTLTHSTATQTFPFGLTSGSAKMGPRHYFGWIDSDGGTATNQGVVSYDINATPGNRDFTLWYGAPGAISVGTTRPLSQNLNRSYSLQATLDVGPAAEAIGNSAHQRATEEMGLGGAFVLDDPFTRAGHVTQWAAWTFTNESPPVTPLVFEKVGSNFFLRGIGATRIWPSNQGTITYDFGLVSGSNFVDSDYYFGWYDGSITAGTGTGVSGSMRYNTTSFGSTGIWFGNNLTNFNLGTDFGTGTPLTRYYSVQAIAVVPEPAALTLGALSLLPLGLVGWRRRRR